MPIQTFVGRRTAAVFAELRVHSLPHAIQPLAKRKLDALNATRRLEDLMRPPSNRLEALKGKRAGQYSIRLNEQWRICFRWLAPDAFDVEICDYHR